MLRPLLLKLPPQHYVQVQRTLQLYRHRKDTYEAATSGRTVCLLFA